MEIGQMATTPGARHAPFSHEDAAEAASEALLKLVLSSLDDDKAEDVVTIGLRGKSVLADHMVIASGRSSRQVSSIAEKLTQRLKDAGYAGLRTEGLSQGDWALIDAGDVIVHVFQPDVRAFYDLERMWSVPGDTRRG